MNSYISVEHCQLTRLQPFVLFMLNMITVALILHRMVKVAPFLTNTVVYIGVHLLNASWPYRDG